MNRDSLDVSLMFSPQLEGRVRPWSASHLGLRYPGEVVVAPRWSDSWGRELTEDRYFRIVFLTSRSRSLAADLRDARIVVCIPAQDVLNQRRGLDRDLRSIAEARGLYTTGRQADASSLRSTLDRREAELWGEFIEGCTRSYRTGQIRSMADTKAQAGGVFDSLEPEHWLQSLAGAALARVYPVLPIDTTGFSRTLDEPDLPALFDGLLADAPQPLGKESLKRFAVGLGLAQKEDPATFNPQGCAVFELIQREMEHQGSITPVTGIARLLGHSYGIPLPLATLFLLAFVKHSHPETELELATGHSLTTARGDPFPGDRLTRDLVGQLRWHEEMGTLLTSLHLPEPPTWNTALPYIRVVLPEEEQAVLPNFPRQEAALLSRLSEIGESARQSLADIHVMLGGKDAAEVEGRLRALIELGERKDFQEFYDAARRSFRQPGFLAAELQLPSQVQRLKAVFPEIAPVRSYLREMSFGSGMGSLTLDHKALTYESDPSHFLESANLWPGVKGRFEHLRRAYKDAYMRHHGQYRAETSALWARLQHALPLVEALEQFNSIPEIGSAVGEELPRQFERLNIALKMCPAQEGDISLEDSPMCPFCGLHLAEVVPHQEVETLLTDIEQAVREQYRRLSVHGIQQILSKGNEAMVDKLIKIVHMADLDPLSNVLSPQVVDFLRAFLASR